MKATTTDGRASANDERASVDGRRPTTAALLMWGVALALLVVLSVALDETPLTPVLEARLQARSAKASVVREALALSELSNKLAFSPPGGYYAADIAVDLRAAAPNARILFTTDGSVPTYTLGLLYQQPIYLDGHQPSVVVLRAREVLEDGQLGPVVSASFVMGVQAQLPILSLIIDPTELSDLDAHYRSRGATWERAIHLTYVTPEHQVGFSQAAGLRIRGRGLQAQPKKSFWLYFRQEYGQARLDYPLFGDSEVRSFKRLVLDAAQAAGGTQSEADKTLRWTMLENQLTSELAQAMGGYAPRGQFVALFLNGQPWGIYNLRERLDDFFLQDHFNIQEADLIENKQAQSGDLAQWDALMEFVQNNSLADPQNFAFVQTLVDVPNFTDYAILQMYTANDDWPQHLMVRARPRLAGGRWFWLSWDAARGYGATGDPDFNAVEWATRSYPLGQHEGGSWLDSTLLLRSLLQNDGYRAAFIGRATDLLNGVLSPDAVIARIDRNAAYLAADIHYEENRWPSPLGWQSNIQAMREWAQARPAQMGHELMSKFDLPGTVMLEFGLPSEGRGYVVVNDWPLRQLPWRGNYFSSGQVRVTAVPEAGYVFAGWNVAGLPTTPQITLTALVTGTLSPRFALAPAGALRPNDAILNEMWLNDNGTPYASLGGRSIEGDWFEILVVRDKLDMRGWRITDNDTKLSRDEGSLILPGTAAWAALPRGTIILMIATESEANALNFARDDLDATDGQMILYVGNGNLDTTTDPGFGLGRSNDSLALLAPGPTASFADDVGIDFIAEGSTTTPASFGVLTDGVVFEQPFRRLAADNGCFFTTNHLPGRAPLDNDDGGDPQVGDDQAGPGGWLVDLGRTYSGDDVLPGTVNRLTPGRLNAEQGRALGKWGF